MNRPRAEYRNPPGIGLWGLIMEDYRAHESDWFSPGWRVLVTHRFGNWRMGVDSRVLRAPLSLLYRAMQRRVRNKYGIELEYGTKVGRRVRIHHQSGIVVNGYAALGDDCLLRQNVTIGIRSIDEPYDSPTIGKRVDIGAGAVLLGDIHIGDDAVIGANAVVLCDVPPGAVAVGIPARIIKRSSTAPSVENSRGDVGRART